MKPFFSLFLSLLLLLPLLLQTSYPATASSHPDIVSDTCNKCSAGDPNINNTLCITTFDSVSRSHRFDLRGLGLIMTKLAATNVTHTRSKAKKLLKAKPQPLEPYVKSCLETCLELYSDSASGLKDSAKAIASGRYDDANIWISAAVDAPGDCEDGFTEGQIESPLTKENDDIFGLTVIALCITAMLQG